LPILTIFWVLGALQESSFLVQKTRSPHFSLIFRPVWLIKPGPAPSEKAVGKGDLLNARDEKTEF